jgi:beta-galactosidase
MRAQVEAVRSHSSTAVTTNATGMWTNSTDYFEAFGGLDIAGGDIYPVLRGNDMYGATCDFAFHRGLKRAKFWVLETTSGGGQGVWARQGIPQPFPGALRQNAVLAAACDATAITYFQFKMFRFGAEQLEASVLNIDGIPRRQEREFRQAARELAELAPLLESSQVASDVAIAYSYDAHWGIKIKPFNRAYAYQHHVVTTYAALASRGFGCDITDLARALAHYRVVILPCPLLLSDAERELIARFCAGGGTVITTFLAGIKGSDNTAERAAIPARLTGTFGMRVAEGEPVQREGWGGDTSGMVRFQLGGQAIECRNRWWTEMLEPDGAEVIGRYLDTYRKGEAVATRMRHGAGSAIYLGTWPDDDEAAAAILAWAAREGGVSPAPMRLAKGMEAVRRRRAEGDFWMVFNCREDEAALELLAPMRDLLQARALTGEVRMPAKSHLVLAPA